MDTNEFFHEYEIKLTDEQLQKLNKLVDFEIEDSYDFEQAIKIILENL